VKFNVPTDPVDEEVNMAPMIDMVFLLIIFFMVASHTIQVDNPEIDLPIAQNAKVPEELSDRRSITIKSDGVIYVGNTPTPLEKVQTQIEDARKKIPGLKVYVRAAGNTKFKAVREAMEACAQAGAAEVLFATYEQE
jgi:biopolymer transport protein ExbD